MRSREDRAVRLALALAMLTTPACFSDPTYSDRTCTLDEPCPQSYVCGLDQLCHPRAGNAPADGGELADASGPPECGETDPERALAPEHGWIVTYHPFAPDGTIDRARCLGTETLANDDVDFTANTSALAIETGIAAVGRARRTFEGVSLFTLSHDGGLRVRAGGLLLYDTFREGPHDNAQVRSYLHGGESIVFELAVNAPGAHAKINWTSECAAVLDPTPSSWRVRYYRAAEAAPYALDTGDCLGAETLSTITLSFQWGIGAPAKVQELGITDHFGGIYTGPRNFPSATRVGLYYDDGIRISAEGTMLYESWMGAQSVRTNFTMPAGLHQVRVEYFENLGLAGLEFTW